MTKLERLEGKKKKLEEQESGLLEQLKTLEGEEFIMTVPIVKDGDENERDKSV